MTRSPYIDNLEPLILRRDKRPVLFNSRYVTKRDTYFSIPEVHIEGVPWRGASSMIERYIYQLDYAPAFRGHFPITPPPDTTCCLVISWKPTAETIVRYKLFEGVGEILFIPIYSGQTIKGYNGRFQIEVWNTPVSVLHCDSIDMYVTTQVIPEDFCDYGDILLEWPYKICTDFIYNLVGFSPADGDYFTNIDCETTLVKDALFVTYWWLQSINLGTWHVLSLTQSGGMTFSTVGDNSIPPLPEPINHLPLIDRLSQKVFAIRAYAYVEGGIVKATTIVAEEIPRTDESIPTLYMMAPDGKYYGYRVKIGWTDNTYTVRDKTKDQITVDQNETLPPSL